MLGGPGVVKSEQVRDLVNGIGLGGDDKCGRKTKVLNTSVCYTNRFRFCIVATTSICYKKLQDIIAICWLDELSRQEMFAKDNSVMCMATMRSWGY